MTDFVFDHVAQVVPDVAQAVAWYQETLGDVRVLYQDATWGVIEAGGARIAFVVRDQHPGHLAWRVSPAKLEELAVKYGVEAKPHRDGTRSFYLDAPGGQSIEIICTVGTAYAALCAPPTDERQGTSMQ